MKIYLAGGIRKHHEKEVSLLWTEKEMAELKRLMPEVVFLNPAERGDDLSDGKSVFGRDMLQVYSADAVLVDARERRGLGVGAEMMWARVNAIPLIVWAPLGTHYHLEKGRIMDTEVDLYVHPFLVGLADRVVETLEEAVHAIKTVPGQPFEAVSGAMEYYLETQYENDAPMAEVLNLKPQ